MLKPIKNHCFRTAPCKFLALFLALALALASALLLSALRITFA